MSLSFTGAAKLREELQNTYFKDYNDDAKPEFLIATPIYLKHNKGIQVNLRADESPYDWCLYLVFNDESAKSPDLPDKFNGIRVFYDVELPKPTPSEQVLPSLQSNPE